MSEKHKFKNITQYAYQIAAPLILVVTGISVYAVDHFTISQHTKRIDQIECTFSSFQRTNQDEHAVMMEKLSEIKGILEARRGNSMEK